MINIRPAQGNRSRSVENPAIQAKIKKITPSRELFFSKSSDYLITLVITPEPTVLPPSRIAKRS